MLVNPHLAAIKHAGNLVNDATYSLFLNSAGGSKHGKSGGKKKKKEVGKNGKGK